MEINGKVYSQKDVESLIESNRILKEHLEFLRIKYKNANNLLDLYITASQKPIAAKNFNLISVQ